MNKLDKLILNGDIFKKYIAELFSIIFIDYIKLANEVKYLSEKSINN